MTLNDEGLALIRRFEGLRTQSYRCPAGIWTIGYGHTAAAGPPAVTGGMTVSPAEADHILARDAAAVAGGVAAAVTVPLTDHQFSALVSFAYNVGLGNFRRSSVLAAVNAGDFAAVPRRLQLWCKASGKVLPGLVRRRAAEAGLFAGGSGGDGAVRVDPGELAPVDGKAPLRSSTIAAALAAAFAALGALATPPAGALVLTAVVVVAAAWIIRERLRKSQLEGI